jgi:Ca-activated chloride channel family protein
MVAEVAALGTLAFVGLAEILHAGRCRRAAPLAFGPTGRPRAWARPTPALRAAAAGLLAWGLATLLLVEPKVFVPGAVQTGEPRHVVLVLDVSPSMKLEDAGPQMNQSRSRRVAEILESFFKRVPMESIRLTLIAAYNGALPVVEETRDLEVVRNCLDDLPMYQAFESGKTNLFAGLEEAARVAAPWKLGSASLIVLTDGDTLPAARMPRLPPSISDVAIVGVGDPLTGKFIDGHHSRQDVSTLRQLAARLRGTYHDGNQKHLSTDLAERLAGVTLDDTIRELTRRELALIATAAGAAILALLPLALAAFGAGVRPGVPARRFLTPKSVEVKY